MGLVRKIVNALRKTRESFARKLDALLSGGELTEDFYEELEEMLISSDVGAKISIEIVEELRAHARKNKIRNASDVKKALKEILSEMFVQNNENWLQVPAIITIVGVNGVGKTTTIGKLAYFLKKQGKEVSLVAGDTFRAAAADQLTEWANKAKVRIIKHTEGADSAAVVYDGISSAKAKKTDVLIIDTAGRLHTKENLMKELSKMDKIITREYPEAHRYNLIVLDATTGQNAINQVESFNEFMKIDGIILTKLDGTARGGVVIAIEKTLNIPVYFIGVGEKLEDIEEFDPTEFINSLF